MPLIKLSVISFLGIVAIYVVDSVSIELFDLKTNLLKLEVLKCFSRVRDIPLVAIFKPSVDEHTLIYLVMVHFLIEVS